MSWKCVCKEVNNPDNSDICINCGRKKPKYLGVKLDINITDNMTEKQKAIWYLMISYNYLHKSEENRKSVGELSQYLGNQNYNQVEIESKIRNFKKKSEDNCFSCLNILEKVSAISEDVQFEDTNGFIQSVPSIKSDCYFELGSIYFDKKEYEKAIEYYNQSYDADPNQVSIYNIAMATSNQSVGEDGLFKKKKREEGEKIKEESVIELLKKTIKYSPYSSIGIKSGIMLMDRYKIFDYEK